MTLRDSRLRSGNPVARNTQASAEPKTDRSLRNRLRRRRRRQDRRLLSETLEQRQLLAGPDLIGIQPNEGELLVDGSNLNVSPNELVFQFDDNAEIDTNTLSGIRITRAGEDGVFESATATSDLGTSGNVLVEFRAAQSGSVGNGVTLTFTQNAQITSTVPVLTVTGNSVAVELGPSTTVAGLVSAFDALGRVDSPTYDAAKDLVDAIQVSGSSQVTIGNVTPQNLTLTLTGANSAEAVTDFGTGGAVRVRLVSQLSGVNGRGTQVEIVRRNFGAPANPVVVVTGQQVRVELNSATGFESTAADFVSAINNNPDASALLFAAVQEGDISTKIGTGTIAIPTLTLSGVTDVLVEPGFIGLGDSPREVVFRFAEPLPDDLYQIDVLGTGASAIRNVDGELFQDGVDLTRQFTINLGPKVVAVVPEPIRRSASGSLSPDVGKIEVHFNDDDLNFSLAQTPDFYQLIFTRDTVTNNDDVVRTPTSVSYNSVTNIATLDFGRPLSRIPDPADTSQFLTGAARLRVGASEGLPTPPTEVSLAPSATTVIEPGDTFDSAFDLNSQWTVGTSRTSSARLSSEIFNTQPFDLDLPGPDLPGTRNIRPDDPSRLERTVPLDYVRNGADVVDGISVIQYDFAPSWLGDDPNAAGILEDRTYSNIISEQQKQRVREVMTLYSEYLGISFVEVEGEPTSDAFISIAVGDLYGGDERAISGDGGLAVVTRDRNGDGIDDLGVLDFQDFDESNDDQFGGEFFRGAFFVVGQLLGYGYADDLPQPVTQSTDFIFSPGSDNETAFPALADIIHGQYLYRPDSTDIDLYKFTVDTRGSLSVETIAERLADASLLDTTLRLYRLGGDGVFEEIAQNDDYFSNDSLIDVEVDAGTYMIGVSARGNTNYDPNIESSGFGGLTEGEYELAVDFKPSSTNAILDTSGNALDGDGDNRPGGVFNFWFVPSDSNNTIYVDKASPAGGGVLGSVGNPFQEIDQALATAGPGDTVRVVGNGGIDGLVETASDNFSYQIGFSSNGGALVDGSSLNLPQGVRMVIDSGAILKLSSARIGIGSTSPLIDVSDSSLQVLGTPTIISSTGLPARDATNQILPGSVFFTSINDDTVGMGNASPISQTPQPGNWGGIDFRGDLDAADESRPNRELDGVFLNHIQFADLQYGGGAVSVGGRQVTVSPIDMAITRATIINSRISNSADAAIAATPDTFTETRFTDPFYQAADTFTPDYERVGPRIAGNTIVDNTFNGLFVRVVTRTGDVLETISSSARFDDSDIVHILTENLIVEGTAGGPILQSSAPSSLLVRSTPITTSGNIAAGTYVYRLTNVNGSGLESASSQSTIPETLTQTGSITLNQLPGVPAGSDFVSRRLYRATVDPVSGLPGEFRLVENLNASSTSFTDSDASGSTVLSNDEVVLRSRLDARLAIDPGTVIKIEGARIEARFGANLIAEGLPSRPIVFTSLQDQRYGGGGTFDTNDRGNAGGITPGDWGGLYAGHASAASIDQAVIAGAGGTTRIEGGFASFNAIEVHQGTLRLANSRVELNADGRGDLFGDRVGRGDNASGSIFVRAASPIIVGNEFIGSEGAAISIDLNSLSNVEVDDHGRSTGLIDRSETVGNVGPLVEGNSLDNNAVNGMVVRGGQLATAGVWDDVDIVHVVNDSIEIPNQHIFGGLRLQSDARGSLVVKFESAENELAGIVVGGTLVTASDEFRDIEDRIGGSLQVIGHPDFPVILTTLSDDTAGAGFTQSGIPQLDTDNGVRLDPDLADQPTDNLVVLPTGPEVDNGTNIDNDVDVNLPGFFSTTIDNGNDVLISGTTVELSNSQQVLADQDLIFQYSTHIQLPTGSVRLSATTITQPATLIADDVVESRGTFAGPGGTVTWIATSSFIDGTTRLNSRLDLDGGEIALGDIQIVSYLDEDVGTIDDILITTGDPGTAEFRAFTINSVSRIGFSHGGFYFNDDLNQINASYDGWAADEFFALEDFIEDNTQLFSVDGTINTTNLPQIPDADFGTAFGPADVTTAFAWSVDPLATSSRVTAFLELLASDPSEPPIGTTAGLWNGIVIREAANDRNVAAIAEREPVRTGFIDDNSIPSQSQFVGELAPNEKSGDENRRLGFIVDGSITQRDDVDVYSFIGQSNTEVWLDIDRTGNQLDSVVELIDANGRVLASSNDSLLAETDPNAIFVASDVNPDAAKSLSVVSELVQSQEIRIEESIVDGTDGVITLRIAEMTPVPIPVASFLADPARAIEVALESAYGDQLGDITASLNRRSEREFDANNPAVITRFGDDFVIQLRFDPDFFVGRTVPAVSISTVGVIGPTSVAASVTRKVLGSQIQDAYSSNPKDAGLRVSLPGESGTRNLYHIRVRSSNTTNPLDFGTLTDPSQIRNGLSAGRYQLQIRLSEVDENAGTQISLADVRFATNGLQIIGQPLHSPLLGEEHEIAGDNDSLENAQPLGYYGANNDTTLTETGPLQSDRLAKSFAGSLDGLTDVDWYSFTVNYENLTRDTAALYLSTVFDLDYASGFARSDMALYVFDQDGQLVLVGGDGNVADDLPGVASSNNTDDLSRGSAGAADPYIGTAELSEGTYFVAVSNQQQVPQPLDQFFNPDSENPLLRLEPIDSVTRIAEDRIDSIGGGTATVPETPLLFDNDSIVDYSFDDVLLYVNTSSSLFLVNPFTGQRYGTVGNFSDEIEEIAFDRNGELFAYSGFGNRQRTDGSWFYYRIDTGTGDLSNSLSTGAGINTFSQGVNDMGDPVVAAGNVGLDVEATTIAALGTTEAGFFVANRPIDDSGLGTRYNTNILYEFAPENGLSNGNQVVFNNVVTGAGTIPREIGQIDTAPQSTVASLLGITAPIETDGNGFQVPSLIDGDTFTLSDGTTEITFEIDSGITLTANDSPILDGDQVQIDSQIFEFNTGSRLLLSQGQPDGLLEAGTTVSVTGLNGATTTFEFVRTGSPSTGNLPIGLLNGAGQPLSADLLAATLADQINLSLNDVQAVAVGDQVTFQGPVSPLFAISGAGVTEVGDNNVSPGATGVNVSENADRATVIARLADAVRSTGVTVVSEGNQLSLPESAAVTISTAAITQTGNDGTGTNQTVMAFPGESASTVAQRISLAVADAFGPGSTISASPVSASGRSIQINAGFVVSVNSANDALVAGGLGANGSVTGIELVTETNGQQNLYALDDNGGLYVIAGGQLNTNGARQIGTLVPTATDLLRLGNLGVTFSGLRSGPVSFNNGELRQTLFGITTGGDIYAFNTAGELQPVFAGGRSVISTGVAGARGLDFSTLGFNLWHRTSQRAGDPGHGINPLFNGTRPSSSGGTSLAFTFEASAFNANFPAAERPGISVRQDGTPIEDTFNLPGGAKGVVQSNEFGLMGYSSADQPTLYFNYFLDTDSSDSTGGDRDALRVYVVTSDGAQHLVASNNTARGAVDEFDDPAPIGQYDDDIDVDVQQLFDNTGNWRQARVPVGSFAGQENLSLRIEFSSGGTTTTGSLSLETVAGRELVDGQTFVVGGETFYIDLSPAISVPSGPQLAQLYSDPNALATITIDDQTYVLDNGDRTGITTEIAIPIGTGDPESVDQLTASEIAALVTEAVRLSPPPNTLIENLDFSEAQDADPLATGGRDDRTFEAIVLPYQGGNVTLVGEGQIGNDATVGDFDNTDPTNFAIANQDDVDLFRVELEDSSRMSVDVVGDDVLFLPVEVAIRLFDEEGVELLPGPTVGNSRTFAIDEGGTYFVGLSGLPNETYNPLFDSDTEVGRAGKYEATFTINTSVAVQSSANLIEFQGLENVSAAPANLFTITGQRNVLGTPIQLSRLMTASEIAAEVQSALADRFADGRMSSFPTNRNTVLIPALTIDDAGPFVDSSERYGDQFGAGAIGGSRDNAFEGAYLDDFIIGFAERGEIATESNAAPGDFIPDGRPEFTTPATPVTNLVTGSYQVEIRNGSEYVNSAAASQFRTFDTNARLSDSRFIEALSAADLRDGSTFSIFDGRSTVVFEFDQVELQNGVVPGNVQVPFTLVAPQLDTADIDPTTNLPIPGTEQVRPQTAAEVAESIVEAIGRSEVQSVIDVQALPVSGVDGSTTARINLFSDVVINNDGGALALVGRNDLRGDDNRERDVQGVILVENSRFLFNEGYGIAIDHGLEAIVAGNENPSIVRYPRNLVELNSESLAPGVVIQSNVIAFNETGGLQINGIDSDADQTQSDPVAFDRIVNNTIVGGTISRGVESPPRTIQGILYPQGQISFADEVVDYSPDLGGSPPEGIFQSPQRALGAPELVGRGAEPVDGNSTVSLGLGGQITLQFTDNLLTGSGDASGDLIVLETGAVESVRVEISRDGVLFNDVGTVGGLSNQIDIDAFGFGIQDRFAFVRLTDLRQGSSTDASLGADIDAVGALSTVSVETFEAGGNAIELTGNAAPALLNNVIANSETGIVADPTNTLTILGGNTFYRNTANVTEGLGVGEFAQELSDAEVIFVNASDIVFAPSAGASIIDSSIDSLENRSSLTAVKNPLGIPPSPILAPRLDVNGQLRIDDPNVETPSGLGERVFKDRGASDRGDLVGPRVVLLNPLANNLGTDAGVANVLGQAPSFFEVQLIDGLAPADVVPGTGIDDASVTSSSILLLENNVALAEGTDYRFGYNPSTNVIRLTPIAGVWKADSTYVIRMIDSSDAIVQAASGNEYVDGNLLNIRNLQNQTTRFEYETGINLTINQGTLVGDQADGLVFTVFDGTSTIVFEFDNNDLFNPINTPIDVSDAGNDDQLAETFAAAVNASGLNLTAVVNGFTVQFLGDNPLATVVPEQNTRVLGSIGTSQGFGIQIPADGADVAETVVDGQTFIVRRGALIETIFEFDDDNTVDTTGAIPISFSAASSLDDIADELVRRIGGAGLGLSPTNVGFGRVVLGGDANFALDLNQSALTQTDFAGQGATLPITIRIDQTATEVAQSIAAAIDAAGIAGISSSIADTRIFFDGTGGVDGVGSVDTTVIQDEVGNRLQSNQADGRTELTIFVGGGFDYGDAPAPYASLNVSGGPRHAVKEGLAIGSVVSADSDAKLPNADDDDGVSIGSVQSGFSTSVTVQIRNDSGEPFFLDAWFDWNADGQFEASEALRFASNDPSRSVVLAGTNTITVTAPSFAVAGQSYARFRLSQQSNLGPTGDATSGEVEDVPFVITTNPFQNPKTDTVNDPARDLQKDVNDSGFVTPIDALQIINAIGRNGGLSIDLNSSTLPANLPIYPDVDGNGLVSAVDALQVINELARLPNTNGDRGEGELISDAISSAGALGFASVGHGVMASGATLIGDSVIASATNNESDLNDFDTADRAGLNLDGSNESTVSKTSVFDSPETVQLDSIVDSLAEDTSSVRNNPDETSVLDELFASF